MPAIEKFLPVQVTQLSVRAIVKLSNTPAHVIEQPNRLELNAVTYCGKDVVFVWCGVVAEKNGRRML